MRRQIRPIVGALLLISLALAPLTAARTIVVQDTAPLRSGPNRTTKLVTTLQAGATAEVSSETAGWLQITLPDGRSGYVFQTHVKDEPEGAVATSTTTVAPPLTADAPAVAADLSPSTTLLGAPPIEDPSAELVALRAKVDALHEALARVHQAEADHGGLVERADGPSRDGVVSWVLAALLVGFGFGFVFSWVVLRRSDRRQWNRLRF